LKKVASHANLGLLHKLQQILEQDGRKTAVCSRMSAAKRLSIDPGEVVEKSAAN